MAVTVSQLQAELTNLYKKYWAKDAQINALNKEIDRLMAENKKLKGQK